MTDMLSVVARAICKAESTGMGQGQACDCDGKTQNFRAVDGRGRKLRRKRPCPYRNEAKAAIEAHEKALEEQGLVIVPREPTKKMQEQGWHEAHDHVDFWDYGGYTGAGYTFEQDGPKAIWQAMLAALEGKP